MIKTNVRYFFALIATPLKNFTSVFSQRVFAREKISEYLFHRCVKHDTNIHKTKFA